MTPAQVVFHGSTLWDGELDEVPAIHDMVMVGGTVYRVGRRLWNLNGGPLVCTLDVQGLGPYGEVPVPHEVEEPPDQRTLNARARAKRMP